MQLPPSPHQFLSTPLATSWGAVNLSQELLSNLLATVTGDWLTGRMVSRLVAAMQQPLAAWQQTILNAFSADYLGRLTGVQKLILASYFEFVLFDTVKYWVLTDGFAKAATHI